MIDKTCYLDLHFIQVAALLSKKYLKYIKKFKKENAPKLCS